MGGLEIAEITQIATYTAKGFCLFMAGRHFLARDETKGLLWAILGLV